jgi:hypothetical protein
MPLRYPSGEEIQIGDRVLYDGVECVVERVADPEAEPEDWHVTEFGGGVLLTDPEVFGRVFVQLPFADEELDLLRRAPK